MSRRRRTITAAQIREEQIGPNMTPMVDVVLVILIFFMASTVFIGPEWFLRTTVREAEAAEAREDSGEALTLSPVRLLLRMELNEAGAVTVGGIGPVPRPLAEALEDLRAFAAEAPRGSIEVNIAPSPAVPYEAVIRAHEACERAKIENVAIVWQGG